MWNLCHRSWTKIVNLCERYPFSHNPKTRCTKHQEPGRHTVQTVGLLATIHFTFEVDDLWKYEFAVQIVFEALPKKGRSVLVLGPWWDWAHNRHWILHGNPEAMMSQSPWFEWDKVCSHCRGDLNGEKQKACFRAVQNSNATFNKCCVRDLAYVHRGIQECLS